MNTILLVGGGGAIGALLRYVVSGLAYRYLGPTFPWGTLVANVLGCFFIGIIWAVTEESSVPPSARLFLLTGVLGAFTTFSTFGMETINLLRDGELGLALTNVLFSNVAGLLAVVLGLFLTRLLLSSGGPS